MRKLVVFFLLITFNVFLKSQSIIIGDSQCYQIEKEVKYAKILKPLTQVGIGLNQLIRKTYSYPVNKNVKNIFLSIGVNDNYNDYGVNKLIELIKFKFPNAKIYAIAGSYGWGNVIDVNSITYKKYINYYKKFIKKNVFVIPLTIGKGDPHKSKIEYKKLGKVIDGIIKLNERKYRLGYIDILPQLK